jgi:hypothetical protein
MLSQTEKEWLLGNKKLSKGHEQKIKSNITKKIQNFQKLELPLLIRIGLFAYPNVTENSNSVTKYSNGPNGLNSFNNDKFDFPRDFMNNFRYTDQNYKIYGGPNAIRTRDPRHVKAVS